MLSQFLFVIKLPFRGPNKVDSFYCDFPKIVKLARTNATKFEFIVTANSGLHEHGHLLPANTFLFVHFDHSLETFFRRII